MRTPATATHTSYMLGVALVLTAAVVLSTFGIGMRQVEHAEGWQILFYRSLSFTFTLLLFIAVRYRGRVLEPFRRIGRRGVVVALFLAVASSCLVFSVLHTTVANALFIVSTTPFFAAALGRLVLGESVARSTWVAMTAALVGVALMVVDGLAADSLLGILFAGGVVLCTAVMLVTVRGAADIDMLPALALAGVFTAAFTVFLVPDFRIPAADLGWILALGAGQYALGFALLIAGTRRVPVAEVTLLIQLETVLGPIWVWLGADEVPSRLTLLGGLIVLGAAGTRAVIGVKQSSRRRA